MKWLAIACAILCATCVGNAPPHASAQRIGKLEQTIGGPHAIGQIGDWLLENDQVRFIIEDKGVGRVNTSFGGSLIDADLQRISDNNTGNDSRRAVAGLRVQRDRSGRRVHPGRRRHVPTDPSVPVMDGTMVARPSAGHRRLRRYVRDGRAAQHGAGVPDGYCRCRSSTSSSPATATSRSRRRSRTTRPARTRSRTCSRCSSTTCSA